MNSISQKYATLEKYVRNPKGRAIIAASLQQPLRNQRDYSAVGRKAFMVDPLPAGSLPYYDKDPDVRAYVVGEEGDNVTVVVKGQRVMFPLFEITAQPEIPITEINNRRFDIIERAVAKATADIGRVEDEKVFGCIDALCDDPTTPNPDIIVPGNLTSSALADGFSCIERNDLRVSYIFMNPKDFSDIRKWDRDTLDPESQGALLKTGVQNSIWGAKFVASRVVPQGTVYLTCEPEFFGRIPVRFDLTVLSADAPKSRTVGFSLFENIGIGLYNPYGAQRLIINRS